MPTSTAFLLTFADIPFTGDVGQIIRLGGDSPEISQLTSKQQPEPDLYGEIQRTIPTAWLRDYVPCPSLPHRLRGLAQLSEVPTPLVEIGQWLYPTGASRWSVFRGLMTSAMVKALTTATVNYTEAKTFTMQAAPISPDSKTTSQFSISTAMRCLPPRSLGENGGSFPGLYLITLVDERWYYQDNPFTYHPTTSTTWDNLISALATDLGTTITYSAIGAEYAQPEPDSPLWCNNQPGALVLNALCHAIGRTCVREYDGTLTLLTWAETQTRISTNRGAPESVIRLAGGDIFTSGTLLPVGDLASARNAVVPSSVGVTFPKYVTGNDPVPHFLNPRTSGNQPTAWDEESYGEVFTYTVAVSSGGARVSGLTGVGTANLHTTAKALYATELAASGNPYPTNSGGVTDLALAIAEDHYDSLVVPSLDEVYVGTPAWTPEGGHDLLFTYSERYRQASLRVNRAGWNSSPTSFQHSTPGVSSVAGVGGRRVPQTWQDTSGNIQYGVNYVKLGAGAYLGVSGTNGGINELTITVPAGAAPGSGSSINYDNTIINIDDSDINVYHSGTINVQSGGVFNLFGGGTFNFGGGTVNVTNNTSVFVSSGQVLTFSGGKSVTFNSPLVICGYQFWCCKNISTSGIAAITNWDLPQSGGAATVYTVNAASGTTIVRGIINAQSGQPQLIGLVNVNSGTELRLIDNDGSTDTLNRINLPSAWSGDVLAMYDGDATVLWWDECDADAWRVLATTSVRGQPYLSGQSIYIATGNVFYLNSGATTNLNGQIFSNAYFNGGYHTYFFSGSTGLGSGFPVFTASGLGSVQGSYSFRLRNDALAITTALETFANTYNHYGLSGQHAFTTSTSGQIHTNFIETLASGPGGPPFKNFDLEIRSQVSGAVIHYDGVVTVAVDAMAPTNTSGFPSVGPIA